MVHSRHRTRFRRRATFFIFIGILVIVSSGMVLRYNLGYDLLVRSSHDEYKRIAYNAAASISFLINKKIENLDVMLSSFGLGEVIAKKGPSAFTKLESELNRFVSASDDIDALAVVDSNLGIIMRAGSRPDTSFGRHLWPYAFNHGRGRVIVSDLDSNPGRTKNYIYFILPVKDGGGSTVGIVSAAVCADKTFGILSDFRFGNTGHTVLVDQKGRTIYHPGKNIVNVRMFSDSEYHSLSKGKELDIDLLSYGRRMSVVAADVAHHALFRKTNTWKVIALIDSKEMLGPMNELTRQGMIVSGFLIFILFIVGFVFRRFFTKPMRKLRDATQKISAGDLGHEIDIKTGDEIEELAESFMVMVRSIKEERRKLVEEKAYLETMVDNMYGGVFMIDNFDQVIALNHQAKIFLGLGLGPVDADVFIERINNLGLRESFDACRRRSAVVVKDIIFNAEEERTIRCETSPVKNEGGLVIGFVTGIRDVTHQKEIDRMKNSFISLVSHELRTPLAIIKEAINLILDKIPGPTNTAQDTILCRSKANIERLERIVDNLLDISKIEAGRSVLRREFCDIVSLARDVGAGFETLVNTRGLSLKFDLPESEILIHVDRDKIAQVFTNLLGNAVKFTEKGFVQISVEDKGDSVECAVIDSGLGIAKGDLPHVFDKFQQFGRRAGAGEKGTGLGLAIAKGIVELHKGSIYVRSSLGQGSKFIFTLPKYRGQDLALEVIDSYLNDARHDSCGMIIFVFKLEEAVSDLESLLSGFSEKINAADKAGDSFHVVFLALDKFVIVKKSARVDSYKFIDYLSRSLKQFLFEHLDQKIVDFYYGFSLFPDDAGKSEKLIGLAQDNMISCKARQFKKHILIVDDELSLCQSLQNVFSVWGYDNVAYAASGLGALEKVERQDFDLIILDIKMPEMNGYEVIGRLKENVRTKDIPILIMSGYEVEIAKIGQYFEHKGILTVSKPLDLTQLEKFVYYLI